MNTKIFFGSFYSVISFSVMLAVTLSSECSAQPLFAPFLSSPFSSTPTGGGMSSPMGAAIPGGALWGGSGSGAPSRDLIERLYGDAPDQVLFQSPGKGTSCKYYESPNAGNSITGIAPESVQTGSYIDTYDAMNGVAAHTQLTNTIISPMIYASDVNSPNGVNFLRVEWLNSLMQLSGDSGVTWTPFDFTTWLANHPLPGPYAVYTEIFGNTPRPSQMMFGSDGNFYVGLALYKWGSYFNQQKIGMFGFLKIPSGFFENPNNPNEQPSFIMVSEFGGSTAGGPNYWTNCTSTDRYLLCIHRESKTWNGPFGVSTLGMGYYIYDLQQNTPGYTGSAGVILPTSAGTFNKNYPTYVTSNGDEIYIAAHMAFPIPPTFTSSYASIKVIETKIIDNGPVESLADNAVELPGFPMDPLTEINAFPGTYIQTLANYSIPELNHFAAPRKEGNKKYGVNLLYPAHFSDPNKLLRLKIIDPSAGVFVDPAIHVADLLDLGTGYWAAQNKVLYALSYYWLASYFGGHGGKAVYVGGMYTEHNQNLAREYYCIKDVS